jgi:hypothetical protein
MSKMRNAVRRLGCRRVRRWLQERHDREGTEAVGLAAAAEVHLQGCPACRQFQEFLAGYGRVLGASLDDQYVVRTAAAAASPTDLAAPDRDAPERWARRPAARWSIPAAAAFLVIAAGTQVPRFAAGVLVERRIRREVAALVEAVYSRPLAQGVETALSVGSLIEELEELEGLAEGDGLYGVWEGEGEDLLVQ